MHCPTTTATSPQMYMAEVEAERKEFGQGVSGVPHFIVDGRLKVRPKECNSWFEGTHASISFLFSFFLFLFISFSFHFSCLHLRPCLFIGSLWLACFLLCKMPHSTFLFFWGAGR